MSEFKFFPIPAEDYDALGIGPDTILETSINDNGVLMIRVVSDEDLDDFR